MAELNFINPSLHATLKIYIYYAIRPLCNSTIDRTAFHFTKSITRAFGHENLSQTMLVSGVFVYAAQKYSMGAHRGGCQGWQSSS